MGSGRIEEEDVCRVWERWWWSWGGVVGACVVGASCVVCLLFGVQLVVVGVIYYVAGVVFVRGSCGECVWVRVMLWCVCGLSSVCGCVCDEDGVFCVCRCPRGPMDKASAYEAGDCGFESRRGLFPPSFSHTTPFPFHLFHPFHSLPTTMLPNTLHSPHHRQLRSLFSCCVLSINHDIYFLSTSISMVASSPSSLSNQAFTSCRLSSRGDSRFDARSILHKSIDGR